MTIKELYHNINGDYEKVFNLIPSDTLIARFVKKFPDDSSFCELMDAIEKKDIRQSFEASHKLKGLVANLSFSKLYSAVSALTEQLRSCSCEADTELVGKVILCYQEVIEGIKQYESEQCSQNE